MAAKINWANLSNQPWRPVTDYIGQPGMCKDLPGLISGYNPEYPDDYLACYQSCKLYTDADPKWANISLWECITSEDEGTTISMEEDDSGVLSYTDKEQDWEQQVVWVDPLYSPNNIKFVGYHGEYAYYWCNVGGCPMTGGIALLLRRKHTTPNMIWDQGQFKGCKEADHTSLL